MLTESIRMMNGFKMVRKYEVVFPVSVYSSYNERNYLNDVNLILPWKV